MSQDQSLRPDATGLHDPSGVPATRMRYLVLAVFCGLAFLTYVHRQAFVRGQTEIQIDLALDDQQMSYLTAAFLLGYALFQVPCGLIGDRLGARHLVTILILGWSLLTGLTALADVLPRDGSAPLMFLIGARFLFGAFQAGFFPAWSRVLADWITVPKRASAQGSVWMFSRVGGAVAPAIFLLLFRFFNTWTVPFWVFGGFGIVCAIAFWLWFRNRPEEMPGVNRAELELISGGRIVTSKKGDPVPWSVLLRSLNVWALCLMYAGSGFAGNFFTNLLPVYLQHDRNLSKETTTWLTGLPLAVGIVSCALGGLLSDWIVRRWGSRKWGRRFNGSVGMVLSGLALAAIPWVHETGLLALAIGATFFLSDLNMAPAWAACVDVGEGYAGTISGAMNMVGNLAGVAGMLFAGFMLHRGHVEVLFIIFACSYGWAALCWLMVDVTRPLKLTTAAAEPPSS